MTIEAPAPTLVRDAVARLAGRVHRTPVLTSRALDDATNLRLFFKCENFQRVGAFKFRGAINAVLQLDEDARRRGVITHSSGNHGQALALASRLEGVPCCVVMPRNAPSVKRAATEGQGARVVECEPTLAAREEAVAREVAAYGYSIVHPFDDWRVIGGQGTAAWELIDEIADLDVIITPCGGGGLLTGTALAVAERGTRIRVWGAEPANADDARRSLESGSIVPSLDPVTVADGLRTSLGVRPWSVIQNQVERIITATEAEILDTLRLVMERMKIIVEPSCVVPLAALKPGMLPAGTRVGIVLTGGNIDLGPLFDALRARWLS
jgi:threonine dehydratase